MTFSYLLLIPQLFFSIFAIVFQSDFLKMAQSVEIKFIKPFLKFHILHFRFMSFYDILTGNIYMSCVIKFASIRL